MTPKPRDRTTERLRPQGEAEGGGRSELRLGAPEAQAAFQEQRGGKATPRGSAKPEREGRDAARLEGDGLCRRPALRPRTCRVVAPLGLARYESRDLNWTSRRPPNGRTRGLLSPRIPRRRKPNAHAERAGAPRRGGRRAASAPPPSPHSNPSPAQAEGVDSVPDRNTHREPTSFCLQFCVCSFVFKKKTHPNEKSRFHPDRSSRGR